MTALIGKDLHVRNCIGEDLNRDLLTLLHLNPSSSVTSTSPISEFYSRGYITGMNGENRVTQNATQECRKLLPMGNFQQGDHRIAALVGESSGQTQEFTSSIKPENHGTTDESTMDIPADILTQDLAEQLQQLLQQQQKHFENSHLTENEHRVEPHFSLSHLEAFIVNDFSEDSDKENSKNSSYDQISSAEVVSTKHIQTGEFSSDKNNHKNSRANILSESLGEDHKMNFPANNISTNSISEHGEDVKEGIYYEYNNNIATASYTGLSEFVARDLNVTNSGALAKTVDYSRDEGKSNLIAAGDTGSVDSIPHKNERSEDTKRSCYISSNIFSSTISSNSSISSSKNKGCSTVFTLGNISSMMGKSVIMGGGVKASVGGTISAQGSEQMAPAIHENLENNEEPNSLNVSKSTSGTSGLANSATKRPAKTCKLKPDKSSKSAEVVAKPDGGGHTSIVGGVRRNERERNRVKQVNLGFDRLRQHVPQGRRNKKLSKVDTLRAAVDYIAQLRNLLQIDSIVSLAQDTYIPLTSNSPFEDCLNNSNVQMNNNWCDVADLEQLQQQQLELHQQQLQLHQQFDVQQLQPNESQLRPELLITNMSHTDGVMPKSQQRPSQNLVTDPMVTSSDRLCANSQELVGSSNARQLGSEQQLISIQQQQHQQQQQQELHHFVSSSHMPFPQVQHLSTNSQLQISQQLMPKSSLTELLFQGETYPVSIDTRTISPASTSSSTSSIGYGSLAGDELPVFCPGMPNRGLGEPQSQRASAPNGRPLNATCSQSALSLASPVLASVAGRTGDKAMPSDISVASLMSLINGGEVGDTGLTFERASSWIHGLRTSPLL